MTLPTTEAYAGLATGVESGHYGLLEVESPSRHAPLIDFRRLVRLVQENERLLAELDSVRAKVRVAWSYASEPGSNASLAMAHLERLRLKRSALLTHLRANRIEARELLGRPTPGDDRIELN